MMSLLCVLLFHIIIMVIHATWNDSDTPVSPILFPQPLKVNVKLPKNLSAVKIIYNFSI